jgi:hypothetical protein
MKQYKGEKGVAPPEGGVEGRICMGVRVEAVGASSRNRDGVELRGISFSFAPDGFVLAGAHSPHLSARAAFEERDVPNAGRVPHFRGKALSSPK